MVAVAPAPYRNHTCLSDRPDSSAQADEIQAAGPDSWRACLPRCQRWSQQSSPSSGWRSSRGWKTSPRTSMIRLHDQHRFGNCGVFRVGSDAALPGMASFFFLARLVGASGGGGMDHARGYGAGLRGTRGVLRANPWRAGLYSWRLRSPRVGLRQRWRSLSRSAGLRGDQVAFGLHAGVGMPRHVPVQGRRVRCNAEPLCQGRPTISPPGLDLSLIGGPASDRAAIPRPAAPGGCRPVPARRGGRRRGRSSGPYTSTRG